MYCDTYRTYLCNINSKNIVIHKNLCVSQISYYCGVRELKITTKTLTAVQFNNICTAAIHKILSTKLLNSRFHKKFTFRI